MSDRMLSDEILLGLIKANSGGGGGTSNYNQLENKPQIGGVTLQGNKSLADLGIASATDLANKVDKVNGKGLSTNDYSNEDKAIVDGVTAALAGKQDALTAGLYIEFDGDEISVKRDITQTAQEIAYNFTIPGDFTLRVKKYVNSDLVDTTDYTWNSVVDPINLDSIMEVSKKAGNYWVVKNLIASTTQAADYSVDLYAMQQTTNYTQNFVTTIDADKKLIIQSELDSAVAGKVDKVTGKGLSANDYTNADKAIVDGVTAALATKVDKVDGKGLSANDYTNADKAIVDGVTTALAGKVDTSSVGAASGVAELDANGKVPSSQLPSYVDDVLEYASLSNFPAEGETGKIYIAKDTNKTYRWSGTAYVEISESLALGETSSTAYAGNKGKANADAIAAIKDGTSIDSFADVETALAGKQGTLTFDDTPTDGSNNPVKSNGIYDALATKANTDIVASDFDATASYTAGNYCIYEGKFYKFKASHSGAWSASDVDEIKIAGELASLRSGLTNITTAFNGINIARVDADDPTAQSYQQMLMQNFTAMQNATAANGSTLIIGSLNRASRAVYVGYVLKDLSYGSFIVIEYGENAFTLVKNQNGNWYYKVLGDNMTPFS